MMGNKYVIIKYNSLDIKIPINGNESEKDFQEKIYESLHILPSFQRFYEKDSKNKEKEYGRLFDFTSDIKSGTIIYF